MNRQFNENNLKQLIQERYGIFGNSKPMDDALSLLIQAAPTDLAVLVTGETGTGKELFANALHGLSNRKKFPFVSVNCGAIPETLLESELFGHEKGAFTGATDSRKGFFESAHKGTIFLDEIGEMPVGTQVKLLRILESGEFSRLGSSANHKVDVRIIAATNRELEYEVDNGNFRQDLFFRLKSVHIHLPPLRSHPEDIMLLVDTFAERTCEKLSLKYDGISNDALIILKNLPWPGNIRELRNLVESVVTLEQATYITPDILRRYIRPALPAYIQAPQQKEISLVPYTKFEEPQHFELELIFRTLLELKNDITEVKHLLHSLTFDVEELKGTAAHIVDAAEPVLIDDVRHYSEDALRLDEMEKRLITEALSRFDGNRRLAADALGISERTLYRKIKEYGMDEG